MEGRLAEENFSYEEWCEKVVEEFFPENVTPSKSNERAALRKYLHELPSNWKFRIFYSRGRRWTPEEIEAKHLRAGQYTAKRWWENDMTLADKLDAIAETARKMKFDRDSATDDEPEKTG